MSGAERAIRWLERDPLLHVNMLESIRSGAAELLAVEEEGVLLFDRPSGAYMLSAAEKSSHRLLHLIPHAALFVGHQEEYAEAAAELLGLPKRMTCFQAVYQRPDPLPVVLSDIVVSPLADSDFDFVYKNYSSGGDPAYLRGRLRAGALYGAVCGGALAGFIGRHAEGSMGMLEVLPEYRRRGIARALATFLINRFLAEGKLPFSQVVAGNEASMALHRGLGFSFSSQTMYWLM